MQDKAQNKAEKPFTFLFIGFVWPEITATAASQNIISYMQCFLGAGHRVHFACAAQSSPLSSDLNTLGIEVHSIQLNSDTFDVLLSSILPDIVVFDRFLTEEQFGWRVMKRVPDALRVLDCEDLHFLRHARHEYYKKQGYTPQSADYLNPECVLSKPAYLYNSLTQREMACIYRCDLSITLSRTEAELLVNTFKLPPSSVVHVPYILNSPLEASENFASLETSERNDFVSIGNFRHAPNIDAVNILIQHIWPKIRLHLPKANCHIYGAYLPPKIKVYHAPEKGLYVHGHVDDHFKILRNARVLLAPIQFGAGVKGKIVDALRCQLPSVTTPIGVEGIAYDKWPGAIVRSQQHFVDKAIDIYNNEKTRDALLPLYSKVLRENFDPASNKSQLIKAVSRAFHARDCLRQTHFLQQLVSHHSLQTHQYMSQWIAAKNAIK